MNRSPRFQTWLYRTFLLILLSALLHSTDRLTAQPIDDEHVARQTIYFPFSTTTIEENGHAYDDPPLDSHSARDHVPFTATELAARSDPMAGRISSELRAAAVSGLPNQVGQWSSVINTPVVPIFVALMPNGKVLMFDYDGDSSNGPQNDTRAAVWDPQTDTYAWVNVDDYNLFCAGYVHLSDGRLFVAGGNTNEVINGETVYNVGIEQTHIFDHNTNTWLRGPDMGYKRWYPSVASLANEELFVMAGDPDMHQVYQIDGTFRDLTGAVHQVSSRDYPMIQMVPDGRVVSVAPEVRMRTFDTSGTGALQDNGVRDGWYRGYGSYAMYDIGKMIVSGGTNPALKSAVKIDVNGSAPVVSNASDMLFRRRQHNLTILPDGRVLATGGLTDGDQVNLNTGVYAAEVWDPATDTWTEWASMAVTRQYHSTALLLPDGRIMSGGTGWCGQCTDANYQREDVEYFSPPYLFDSSGNPAARPTVSSVPDAVAFGRTFEIDSPNAASIDKLSLIRLGAPTHAQDMGQRFIPLSFTQSGNTLTATAPANANIAPPGYYMLFLVNNSGVPSIAEFVRVDEEIDQIAPLDAINTTTPTFEWRPRPTATAYKLAIYDKTNTNVLFFNDGSPYDASIICTGNDPAADTCSVQPNVPLNSGVEYYWLVKAFVNDAPGPWSIYP